MPIDDDSLQELLERELVRVGVPGAAAGILHGGSAALAAAGVARVDTGEPVTPETPFRVASITKSVTATAARLLELEGLLALDDPLRAVLPGLRLSDPAAEEALTPRLLLAHASGLDGELPGPADWAADDGALARLVGRAATLEQLVPPGELWAYGNAGYCLAGAALAAAAGETYEAVVDDLVLRPLRMAQSSFPLASEPPDGAALGHVPDGDGHRVAAWGYPRSRMPSGGLVSTVGDLLAFAALHLEDPALAALREPLVDAVGLAWGTGLALETLPDGAAYVHHSGRVGGFQTQLGLVPELGLALVVLTNGDRGSLVVRRVVDEILAAAGLARPLPEPVADDGLERFAGRYAQGGLVLEVTAREARLAVAPTVADARTGETLRPAPFEAVPFGRDRFVVREGDALGTRLDFPREGWIRSGRLARRLDPRRG